MTTVESLVARLGLDYSEFKEGMVKSGEAVQGVNQKLTALQEGLAGGAIVEFVKNQLESAAATKHFAENVGASTDAYQALTFAAREHSVTQEEVQRVWTQSRVEIDKLAEGDRTAADTFAKLGLSAEDFKGLNMDQALQKIAAAYAENEDHAGALDALQTILGRTSRNMTTTMVELGEQGFGTFIAKAKEAHAVVSEQTLTDLERTNKEWESYTNILKVGGAEIVGILQRIMSAIGFVAGGFEQFGEALLKGGPFTQAGRDQIKATWQALTDINSQLNAGVDVFADNTKKAAAATREMTPALVEQRDVQEARLKLEEAIGKADEQGLSAKDKLAQIDKEIEASVARALAAGNDQVKVLTEGAIQAKLQGDYAKIESAAMDQSLAAELKAQEQRRAELPLWAQRAALVAEIQTAAATEAEMQTKSYDTAKARAAVDKTTHDLHVLDVQIAQDEITTAQALLSNDVQRAEQAKIHWQLMTGQTIEARVLGDLYGLLSRGAENLTDQEKIHAKALFDNLEPLEQQKVLRAEISGDVDHLTQQEKDLLGVITGQTKAIKDQKNAVDAAAGAWNNYHVAVSGGADYASMSNAALQGTIDRLNSHLADILVKEAPDAKTPDAWPVFLFWARQSFERELISQEFVAKLGDALFGFAARSDFVAPH